jgi:predicted nuclease of restriction endonuclease-like (RecB) superfamily
MKKSIIKKNKDLEPREYANVLLDIKNKVHHAQNKSILAANKELLKLYWEIGQTLSSQQEINNWGTGVIEKFAEDLQKLFPGISGFSRRNIFRMQAFFLAYTKVPQAVALITDLPIFSIPWGHNAIILEKIKKLDERLWYAQKSIENGWSRITLETQIKKDLYNREGMAITNFKQTLTPTHYSISAQQTLKDPYIFDFLTLNDDHIEHELEHGLVHNVQNLLLEMGKGFALVGRQYHLEVGEKDYYIDLLFYHTKLKCYVVVELKAREFDPRDAGQLNFYLSAVDDLVRDKEDKPTIGLLLCRTKDNFTAEYSLRGINKPIGVAEYHTELIKKLPKELKSKLPTIAEIEAELEKNELLETKKRRLNEE